MKTSYLETRWNISYDYCAEEGDCTTLECPVCGKTQNTVHYHEPLPWAHKRSEHFLVCECYNCALVERATE